MPWYIEDLTPEPDGVERDFTITHLPVRNSMVLFLQSAPLVETTQFPVGGRYRRVGLNVTLGLIPATGEHLWTRYFYI